MRKPGTKDEWKAEAMRLLDVSHVRRDELSQSLKEIDRLRELVRFLLVHDESAGAEIDHLRGLLGRIVKYAVEDRAVTPGSTRLARAITEASQLLVPALSPAPESQVGGDRPVTRTGDAHSSEPRSGAYMDIDDPSKVPGESAASAGKDPGTTSASQAWMPEAEVYCQKVTRVVGGVQLYCLLPLDHDGDCRDIEHMSHGTGRKE